MTRSDRFYQSDVWSEGDDHFTPLRKEAPVKVVLALLVGPAAWAATLLAIGYLVHRTHAIQFGLLVTGIAFGVAMIVLPLLYLARGREERRYYRRQQGRH